MAKAKLTREKLLVNLVSEEIGASTDTVEKVLGLMEKLEVIRCFNLCGGG